MVLQMRWEILIVVPVTAVAIARLWICTDVEKRRIEGR